MNGVRIAKLPDMRNMRLFGSERLRFIRLKRRKKRDALLKRPCSDCLAKGFNLTSLENANLIICLEKLAHIVSLLNKHGDCFVFIVPQKGKRTYSKEGMLCLLLF